ncbi:MAG: helix-turn-helix transcriptional regulator [Sandaracinaceae bacterium]|nr:helix-turn-helix transcriptional regulator [Sandaracinaceae bacterium]
MPRRPGSVAFARKLGARIRSIRKEEQLTQEKLAWDADLAKAYLSQVEAGKRLPSLPALLSLAKRLDVELADLVGFDLDRPRLALLDAARRADRDGVRVALGRLRQK